MSKITSFVLTALITLSTLPSCRKVYDFIRDHPDAHNSLCRVTKLTYGTVFPPGSPFIGGIEVGIRYNAKGNPDSILLLHKPVPYFGMEQYFRYDRFDRLTDYILNYTGGLDPLPYVPTAIIWHKYAYPHPGIITDTVFTYETAPVNGPPPIAKPGQGISIYKFDAAGKMIAIAETSNMPNLPPPVFTPVAYDARGNGDLSDRPDLTETPYVVALSSDDPVAGHLESYSAVRVRRDRLSGDSIGQLADKTMRKLADALALIFDYEA